MLKSWTKRTKLILSSGRIVNRFYFRNHEMSLVIEKDKDDTYLIHESFQYPKYYSRMGFGDTVKEAVEEFRIELKKDIKKI